MHSLPDWIFIVCFLLVLWWWSGRGARLARRYLWPQAGGFMRAIGWTFGLLMLLTVAAWTHALLSRLLAEGA